MSTITMEPQDAITYGGKIMTSASDFKTQVSKIYEIVDELKNTWSGTAASRFTSDIESYRSDYEKFGQLMNDFGALIEALGKDYPSLEDNL